MILVNVGRSTLNVNISGRNVTIGVGQRSINTILSDQDIYGLVENLEPTEIKFLVTTPEIEMGQLAKLEVPMDYIFNSGDDTTEDETRLATK